MKNRRYLGYLLAGVSLTLAFNNCGRPGFNSNAQLDLSSTVSASQGDPNLVNAPDDPGGNGDNGSVSAPTITTYVNGNKDWPLDNSCMTNTSFEACLIWKSPVAHRYYLSKDVNSAIFYDVNQQPKIMTQGTDLSSVTTLAVNVSKWILPQGSFQLKSAMIDVYASNGSTTSSQYLRTAPTPQKYKYSYKNDTNFDLAQISAFYWISYARDFFLARGASYFSDKMMAGKPALPVDAYNPTVLNNGYFTAAASSPTNDRWGKVVLGQIKDAASGRSHELALSAEAYLHEMGHSNLYYAVGGPQNTTSFSDHNAIQIMTAGGVSTNCKTKDGCYFAINEGQADFHSHVLFEQQPYLLEQMVNLATGPNSRNAFLLGTKSAQEIYETSAVRQASTNVIYGGQIHGLGALYGSILYKIYMHRDGDKAKFLKVFTTHLTFIDSYSTFKTAKQDLLDADLAVPGKSLASIINAEFASRGL